MQKQPIHICVQPATLYYAWQIDTMLYSFEKNGEVDLERVHIILAGKRADQVHYQQQVEAKWSEKGVKFFFYEDDRTNFYYISSVRPWLLTKHWKAFPELEHEWIFYHDCDIALTRPLNWDKLITADKKQAFTSDCRWYIGYQYLSEKGHGLMGQMCKIANISPELLKSKDAKESGGAQYVMYGIKASTWQAVYHLAERLFKDISAMQSPIRGQYPDWHDLQIWCADMWALLWQLWREGYTTPTTTELAFSWGTDPAAKWHSLPIFHNAGVSEWQANGPFYKADWIHQVPKGGVPEVAPQWASHQYLQLVQGAIAATYAHTSTGTISFS